MSNIGEKFRDARQNAGLSIQDVARRTKLHASIIEAIEKESFTDMPAPTYTIGFIRTYAKLIGLNPKEMVSAYIEQHKEVQGVKAIVRDRALSPEQLAGMKKVIMIAALLAALAGLVYVISEYAVPKFNLWMAQRKKTEAPKLPAPVPVLPAAMPAVTPPSEAAAPQEAPRTDVAVQVDKDVFVSVSEGESLLFSGTLKSGMTERWRSAGSLTVKVGAPDCARIFVKGQDRGVISFDRASPFFLVIDGDQVTVSPPQSTANE